MVRVMRRVGRVKSGGDSREGGEGGGESGEGGEGGGESPGDSLSPL